MKTFLRYKKTVVFLVLLAIFLYIRLYNINARIIFDWDQEQFSSQVMDILRNGKFTLLGPRVTDVRGFFLAPYFTYILIPFFAFTRLHPIALVLFVAFINILFFGLSYRLITKMFGWKTAMLFLTLWTFSAYHASYDVIPWWPIMLPLGALLTWWSLWCIYKKNTLKNWVILGLVLGFFIHMHFQFIFAYLFTAVFILIIKPKKWYFYSIASVLTILLLLIPLAAFDLRHNFLNSTLFINYFLKGSGDPKDLFVWQIVFTNAVQPFTYIRNGLLAWLFYGLIHIIAVYTIRKEEDKFKKSFFLATEILWITLPFVFAAYGRRPSEYYFLILFPFVYILLSYFLQTYIQKGFIIALLCLFVLINVPQIIPLFQSNRNGMQQKDRVIRNIGVLVKNTPYSVSFDGPPNTDTGFRYLLKLYRYPVSEDPTVPMIGVHIPIKPNDFAVGIYGITIPKEILKRQ
ncbi:MAG: hypothetical protein NUV65_04225 [Candidatus Roizmanbacteria bacterium]|nr:hypothetical protein [Candidatus Roizmanbacteria bacterium]